MTRKMEMQYIRLFEVIRNRPNPYNKVWDLNLLLKAVNFLLPKELVIPSRQSLSSLIKNQSEFKVFRCVSGGDGRYYIFKTYLPVGE